MSIRTVIALWSLAAGCAYHSDYVAPLDGRPRAVWLDNHVVMDPAGLNLAPGCVALLAWVSPSNRLHLIDGDDEIDEDEAPRLALALDLELDANSGRRFWVPRPLNPQSPLRSSRSLGVRSLTPPTISRPELPSRPRGAPSDHHAPATASSGSSGGGGNAGAFNPASLLAVLALIAAITIVALPAVTFGLANSRPEHGRANAEAIDQVNALNDWLRMPNSPCATRGAS